MAIIEASRLVPRAPNLRWAGRSGGAVDEAEIAMSM